MNLELDPALDDFRAMVREAIREDLPPSIAGRYRRHGGNQSDPEEVLEWTRILHKRGWSVPHWPTEYGGTGWSPMQIHVFLEECGMAFAPETCWGATHMCGPVIYTFGNEEQKQRFLPEFRRGDYYLAQGFSEPGNGSDLARLRTRADRVGDKYIVNGQKIWTSSAYASEWGFFLVRTNQEVKPQAGISFLMIKMDTPGVTVRRIPQFNGEADLCETFLDNVEVPIENLIGEEGQGWTYGKFLLDHERTTSSFIYMNMRELERARQILRGEGLADDPAFAARFAMLEADVKALEWSVLRELNHEQFKYNGTAAASTLKIAGSNLQQTITQLQVDALARKSLRKLEFELDERPPLSEIWPDYVESATSRSYIMRAATIYGGTLQVQKGLVAKLAFDL